MATIVQILPRFWPSQGWTIDEDDYDTLQWSVGNSMTKPTEAEIRSHSDEVDALLADELQRTRQNAALNDAPDYLLKAFEVLIDGMIELRRVINDIRNTAVAEAHIGSYVAWDSTIVSKIAAMKQKIDNLRLLP